MPVVSRLTVYPIKSLDGCDVTASGFSSRGSLSMDRVFALVDQEGRFFNGKRDARVHNVRALFSGDCADISLSMEGMSPLTAPLAASPALAEWFSDAFGLELGLVESRHGGFPDDDECPGPTVVALETLRRVGGWFAEAGQPLDDAEVHRRFRTNIVIDDCPAFYEDNLYGDPGGTPFLIGDIRLLGLRASARCAVPARDSRGGGALSGFQKTFVERRRAELPDGVDANRFDHFYRLCVNTRIPDLPEHARVAVGDPVRPEFSFDFEW